MNPRRIGLPVVVMTLATILAACAPEGSGNVLDSSPDGSTVTSTTSGVDAPPNWVVVKYRETPVDTASFAHMPGRGSLVTDAWYDADNDYLIIGLDGTSYHYCGFPESLWDRLGTESSAGDFYESVIKGHYDCRTGHVPSYDTPATASGNESTPDSTVASTTTTTLAPTDLWTGSEYFWYHTDGTFQARPMDLARRPLAIEKGGSLLANGDGMTLIVVDGKHELWLERYLGDVLVDEGGRFTPNQTHGQPTPAWQLVSRASLQSDTGSYMFEPQCTENGAPAPWVTVAWIEDGVAGDLEFLITQPGMIWHIEPGTSQLVASSDTTGISCEFDMWDALSFPPEGS